MRLDSAFPWQVAQCEAMMPRTFPDQLTQLAKQSGSNSIPSWGPMGFGKIQDKGAVGLARRDLSLVHIPGKLASRHFQYCLELLFRLRKYEFDFAPRAMGKDAHLYRR